MEKYRIEINRQHCIGDGLCREEADATFFVDEEQRSSVADPEGNTPDDILYAAWQCPNECITLYDLETGEKAWPRELTPKELDRFATRKRLEEHPGEWAEWRDIGAAD